MIKERRRSSTYPLGKEGNLIKTGRKISRTKIISGSNKKGKEKRVSLPKKGKRRNHKGLLQYRLSRNGGRGPVKLQR